MSWLVSKITTRRFPIMDHAEPTPPLAFTQASPTEIHCVGARGLSFYLPVVPVCGHPLRVVAQPA
jgi:hypothetical protein